MLGGGVYITQNKTLPGSYINFVNTSTTNGVLGTRGVVAIVLPLGYKPGEVIELTKDTFYGNSKEIIGKSSDANDVAMLREIFLHSNKVYVYDIGGETELTVTNALNALEPYEFNVVCAYTNDTTDINTYISKVIAWRDELGKKCQVVVYNYTGEQKHEGVINVVSTIEEGDGHALVAWVAGAEAGCAVNKSCTNMKYDGEFAIVADKTQGELEDCIINGQIAFHRVYGDIRLLEDINTLDVNASADKGEDFKYNQTIRVIDMIANDISKLFNTKYVGNIPNNASGRTSLWGDIVAHHRELETMEAIEKFDPSMLSVEQGATKKSVVIHDAITVINSMAQLYMTVVVQ